VDRFGGVVVAGAGDDRVLGADRALGDAIELELLVLIEGWALAGGAGDDEAVVAGGDQVFAIDLLLLSIQT